jgi:acyl phosphate:glycerol-3-phosphate acyltransferase
LPVASSKGALFLLESNRESIHYLAMLWIVIIAIVLGAYLIGSVPSGYIAGLAKGVDLRKTGSGNIGATNALRVLGKKWGYTVFLADAFKGWLAVTLALAVGQRFLPEYAIPCGVLAAACCVIGHNFPVWLGFEGGKGIATSAGIMIGLFPIWVFLFGITLWTILFFATRYVSVASIAAAISLPTSSFVLMLMGLCDWLRVSVAGILCLLALWRHKPNIERLLAGTEKRFEKKRPQPQS